MIPALFISSSALDANQAMISVVGNNLANSNTAGYKSQSLLFSNQFSQLLSNASEPSATNGGTNPVQVGMGVQVAGTDTNESQGTFQSTGNPLDMAIQNNGYFVLQDGGQAVYTRAGSFSVDSSGNLIDPSTGALVQRVGTVGEATPTTPGFQTAGNNNISLPNNLTIPASATQNISFTGNLSANAASPLSQVLTTGQALTTGTGTPATASTALNSLDQTLGSGYQTGDVIDIRGTRVDGTTINDIYTVGGTTDTLANLLSKINEDYLSGSPTGATASLNSTGQIVLKANQPGPSGATLALTNDNSSATASGTTTSFSSFVQTVVGTAGATSTSTIQVFDAQGTPHNVTFTFQKVSANDWNVSASMNASDGTLTGFGMDNTVNGLTFNANGSLASIAGSSTSETLITQNPFTIGGVAADSTITLDSLDQVTTPYAATDTPADSLTISGTGVNGTAITPVTLPIYDPATGTPATIGDLITAIDAAFGGNVATLDASGNIEIIAPQTGQSQLTLNIADTVGNTGKTNFSNFIQTSPGANGDSNITFQISNLAGLGKPQTVSLNFGTPNSFSGVTQTGATSSVNASNQDGYAQGTLQSTTVNSDGIITGQFTNGKTEKLAQIALATFTNPQGLQNFGSNYFTNTTASGLASITAPGSGGAGTIQSGGLEGSNVNTGTEFTRLIAAQQGYEINAKAFSVANQIMQATNNMIQ